MRPRGCSSSNIWPGSSQSRILSDSSAWPSSIPPPGVRNRRTSAKSRETPASCAASPENTSASRRLSTAAHISQRPRGTLTAEIIEHSGTDHGRVDLFYGLPVQSPVDVLRCNGTDSVGQALGGQLGDGLLRRPLLRPRARSPRLSLTRPRLLAGVCNPPFHFKGFTARGYLIPAGRVLVDKGMRIWWYGRRNNIKRCIKQLNQLTTHYAERTTCCTLTPPKPPSQPSF